MLRFLSRFFKKRKSHRYHVDQHELILFGSNPPEETEIVDLSMGGISFTYTDTGTPIDDMFELDIKAGDIFHLGRTRAKTVFDEVISEVTSESKVIRRRTAELVNMTLTQEYDLKKYLKTLGKP
jgi:hypothetical protein